MQSTARLLNVPTVSDLLLSAPDDQVTRMKIACRAALAGEWEETAHSLRNAINEEIDRMHPTLTATGRFWYCDAQACLASVERLILPKREGDSHG